MSKKILVPILIILALPVFLLLIKLTSMLLTMLFGAGHDESIVYAGFFLMVFIGIAVGVYLTIAENERFYK